jgi:tripartite-type tricarboxylate transporter receptor subunit TctC
MRRRDFITLIGGTAGAIVLPVVSRIAIAQTYPARPVRVIVPFGPAGATDIVARLVGQWLSERLRQQFIIDNRPGAGSNIGTEAVIRSAPDGYTLLLVGPAAAINATLYEKLSFNFIRDIAPVAGIVRFPNVMVVNPSVPAATVPELIAYAKANPGKVNFASTGIGSSPHVNSELFKMMADVDMIHVPYRSAAAAMTDLLSGQMQLYLGTAAATIGYIKGGSLRALAVTTARVRRRCRTSPLSPNPCQAMRRALRMVSAHRSTPRSRSSPCSTRRSTPRWPAPKCRRGLPTWAVLRFPARLPTSPSSSPTKLRNGRRS